jgi:hypothetical protein
VVKQIKVKEIWVMPSLDTERGWSSLRGELRPLALRPGGQGFKSSHHPKSRMPKTEGLFTFSFGIQRLLSAFGV